MFGRRNLSFFIGLGLVIVLLIIVFYLIFHHSTPPQNLPRPLASYASDPSAQVSMLIDGPVNAPSDHNQVQIVINNSSITINVFRGYDGAVVKSKVYANSESSFHVFLRALEVAQFTDGNNDPNLRQASGYCPLGDRYIFSFNVDGQQKQRYWATGCGDKQTFNGNLGLTKTLFIKQVEDYGSLTTNVNI